jgi:hypothetical protein
VSGTNNTGWPWLGPVETSLFEDRHVTNPVVDFPWSGVQVPAAIELDRVMVGFAICQINARVGTRQKKGLVSFDRRRDPQMSKAGETRVGVFACQDKSFLHCRGPVLRWFKNEPKDIFFMETERMRLTVSTQTAWRQSPSRPWQRQDTRWRTNTAGRLWPGERGPNSGRSSHRFPTAYNRGLRTWKNGKLRKRC